MSQVYAEVLALTSSQDLVFPVQTVVSFMVHSYKQITNAPHFVEQERVQFGI